MRCYKSELQCPSQRKRTNLEESVIGTLITHVTLFNCLMKVYKAYASIIFHQNVGRSDVVVVNASIMHGLQCRYDLTASVTA
jgi:hypothetical protein